MVVEERPFRAPFARDSLRVMGRGPRYDLNYMGFSPGKTRA
jgi:hypothetical protein